MKVLITGVAGFIGFHMAKKLLSENIDVIGVDNLNDYYDIKLKKSRLEILKVMSGFQFYQLDICDHKLDDKIPEFDVAIHLAAQAGVRYSISNPYAYSHSNMHGFLNILELIKIRKTNLTLYASSSSVYGDSSSIPLKENSTCNSPESLYAATKISNEAMAFSYAKLYSLPIIGLRFFTVYGPYGRPDMAPMIFANKIFNDESVHVFNNGDMLRDFTYVSDIVNSIYLLILNSNYLDQKEVKCDILNIGAGKPTRLFDFISLLEKEIGIPARLKLLPMQKGDVKKTWADCSKLFEIIKFRPAVQIESGITHFVDWYKNYYRQ